MFLFLISSKSYSQDTLLLDNQIKYYSESDSVDILSFYAKNIYYRADYSRELIKFDNDSAKLEYCFYYDNERIFHENKIYSFKTIHDSIVTVYYNQYSENWNYMQVNDSLFFLSRKHGNLIEKGFAKTIIPLEKLGVFNVLDSEKDTLWMIKYSNFVYPEFITYETQLNDSAFYICDSMPVYRNKESNFRIEFQKNLRFYSPIIESDIFCGRFLLSFVIDKNSQLKNIKFERSCGNGYIEQSILRALGNSFNFECGYMKDKPVNIKMTFPISIHLQ